MGLTIYGTAHYGRVDTQEGEYAQTTFAHLNAVPLFPLRSHWVVRDQGGERVGFPINLHGRSVLAGYLRVWAPGLAGLMYVLSSSISSLAASAVLIVLWAWTWMWRSRRGELARRRGDLDRFALGSRCPPERLTDEMTFRFVRELKAQLARHDDPRSPDDVVRLGPRDVEEAVLTYGLLRLGAIRGLEADARAEIVLADAFAPRTPGGGLDRDRVTDGVRRLITVMSTTGQDKARLLASPPAGTTSEPRWFQRLWLQVLGLLVVSPVLWRVASDSELGVLGSRAIGDAELASTRPPYRQRVAVRCDRVEGVPPRMPANNHGHDVVTLCWIGQHVLPVVSQSDDATGTLTVEGTLGHRPDERWNGLNPHIPLDAPAYNLYLDRGDDKTRRLVIVIVVGFVLLQIAGWVFWFHGLRTRRGRAT